MYGVRNWSKIAEVAAKTRKLGLSWKDGAERFGVKVGQLHEYNRREKKQQRAGGEEAEQGGDREESAKRGKDAIVGPEEVQERIRACRPEHPTLGFKRIADVLKQKCLVVGSRKQIRKVLKVAGLIETCDSSSDRKEQTGGRAGKEDGDSRRKTPARCGR